MAERFYTDDQAQEILRMAARSSASPDSISHSELLKTAAELGIRPEDVLRAENTLRDQQERKADQKGFARYKRKSFATDVSAWLSGSILLYGIAFVSSGFNYGHLLESWAKWPVGFWALMLAKSAIEFVLDQTVNKEAAFERWRRDRDKKLASRNKTEAEDTTNSPAAIAEDAESATLDLKAR